jgi:response regulator of citrate/malate metabolism
MAVTLITKNIWATLTKAAKLSKTKSMVAVAYFGQQGSSMLPLKKGSMLLVDASEKDENGVTVIFKLRKATQKSSEKTTQKTTQETTQKTADKILEIIKINPNYSRTQIAESIGNITADGVKYQLEQLKSKGRIKRIGGDKGGYWEILKTEDK